MFYFFKFQMFGSHNYEGLENYKMNANLIIIRRILFECSFSEYIIMRKS